MRNTMNTGQVLCSGSGAAAGRNEINLCELHKFILELKSSLIKGSRLL